MRTIKTTLLISILLLTGIISLQGQNNRFRWSTELEQLKRVDQLPSYRERQLIEQESSYDRTGGNNDGFSGQYSYIRKEGENLAAYRTQKNQTTLSG